MKIGVVGGGVVGKATARAFVEHVEEVRVYDTMKERATHSLDETLLCNLVFVCLPTPQKKDSLECDLSVVEGFFGHLGYGCHKVNFVLRSTVPIGTTRRLSEKHGLSNLVHSPEFLTARTAVTDAHLPSRNIVGCPDYYGGDGVEKLKRLYESRYPGVPVMVMTSNESEAVKLFLNGFFAVKIAYFNEINALASKLGLNWVRVLAGMLSDGRIAHSHTQVPGPDGKYGFGGACLPKDLASLVWESQIAGVWPAVGDAARKRNDADRRRAS